MKYRDLIQFKPVEDIIKLRNATNQEYARNLVSTYVISDRMAGEITGRIFPQLQFHTPLNNMGLLIVGNYGTGKSHLMGVLSTLAEDATALELLHNKRVKEAAGSIAGQFIVIRTEAESVERSLRDILFTAIESALAENGVAYVFPPFDEILSNKECLVEMMAAFNEKFPEKGLIILLDELLDYLRMQDDRKAVQTLNFLREMGELCNDTRLRFIAGVQEMLFDHPGFQFAASQLNRVRERFTQVSIVGEDVSYVVSQRLLQKSDEQKAWIREHLSRFTILYERLSDKMEEYVELFPIHPRYITVFGNVQVVEKRKILTTLSQNMREILDEDVPENKPGLLSFDRYWDALVGEPSLRTISNIRAVSDRVIVLLDKVESALQGNPYLHVVLRVIKGLAIYRLTTFDIYDPIGLTSAELKDMLFIYTDMPMKNAKFLVAAIETGMKDAMQAVSYQYMTKGSNGQFYIDVKKDIAVDERILERAETLDDNRLNRYYYDILRQVLDITRESYPNTSLAWQYEVPWKGHGITRQGYLFCGTPDERSTAQPPRDFYLYFLPPFNEPKFSDKRNPEEVFFRLSRREEPFIIALRQYAAATELAGNEPQGTKHLYQQKADSSLRDAVNWLRMNMLAVFEMTYRGKAKALEGWGLELSPHADVRTVIQTVAMDRLQGYFDDQYPKYPYFGRARSPITGENLPDYVHAALDAVASKRITDNAATILDGLVLLDGDKIKVDGSAYAKWIMERLHEQGPGKVVTRSQLIEVVYAGSGTYEIERTHCFRMEPELLTVVLAALADAGYVEITADGDVYTAMNMDKLVRLPLDKLVYFSHIKKPADIPMEEWTAIFNLLGIDPKNLRVSLLDVGARQLAQAVGEKKKAVEALFRPLAEGIPCWDGTLLDGAAARQYRNEMNGLMSFLDSLLRYDSPAKMKNLKAGLEDIERAAEQFRLHEKTAQMIDDVREAGPLAQYMIRATEQKPVGDEWSGRVRDQLTALKETIRKGEDLSGILSRLGGMKKEYMAWYMQAHTAARLGQHQDARKSELLYGETSEALRALSGIHILSTGALQDVLGDLSALATCTRLTQESLAASPVCECNFRPAYEKGTPADLDRYEQRMETLLDEWTAAVVHSLRSAGEAVALLSGDIRERIGELIRREAFSLPVDGKLVDAINRALEGIRKATVTAAEMRYVFGDGAPLTAGQIRERMEELLRGKLGKDSEDGVRVVVE